MADGKTHAQAGKAVLIILSTTTGAGLGLAWYTGQQSDAMLALGLVGGGVLFGAVMGYLVTPDIDHPWYTVEEQRIRRRFGEVALVLWHLFWLPFVAAKHRSRLTHSWPVGTLARMGWLFLWAIVGAIALGVRDVSQEVVAGTILFALGCFIGWSAQDLVHLALDGLLP